jgi:hypothetical protein
MGPSMSSDFVVEVLSEWQIRLNLVSGHFRLICSMEEHVCFPKNTVLGTREMGVSHFNFEGTRLGVHSRVCDLMPKADC